MAKDSKSNIKDFNIEELEAEIKRQKRAKVPSAIKNPVMTEKLISGCKEYVELIAQKRSAHESEHWIFEAAVEAVFGENVWKWINSNT